MNSNSLFKPGEKATCANLDKWLKVVSEQNNILSQRVDTIELKIETDYNEKVDEPTKRNCFCYNNIKCEELRRDIMFRATILNIINHEKNVEILNERNLVILNLNYSKNDYDSICSILDFLKVREHFTFKRLGRGNKNKVAPIKCTFEKSNVVKKILKRKNELKKIECYRNVFLAPDLSLYQRIAKKMSFQDELNLNKIEKKDKSSEPNSKVTTTDNRRCSLSSKPSIDSKSGQQELGANLKDSKTSTPNTVPKIGDVKLTSSTFKTEFFTLSDEDLNSLKGSNKLNDNIIDYYFQLICNKSKLKCKTVSSLLIDKVKKDDNKYIKSWFVKAGITNFDLLFFPIFDNEIKHWSLITFDLRNASLNHYDSLYESNSALMNMILKCFKKISPTINRIKSWKFNDVCSYPKQKNSIDCGVFICLYSRFISLNQKFDFDQQSIKKYREIIATEIKANNISNSLESEQN
ncbi:unnamed protein product [Brachionus calyciflorus]|uniref:Ubiquitin-like protease family profile domain-containing protein n=1 Tax=Brachionus calyciflorus TaxID=104777 RepID=A0A814QM23_9BILA|nr:unnamed protein product [Brachionus calyciflorus]